MQRVGVNLRKDVLVQISSTGQERAWLCWPHNLGGKKLPRHPERNIQEGIRNRTEPAEPNRTDDLPKSPEPNRTEPNRFLPECCNTRRDARILSAGSGLHGKRDSIHRILPGNLLGWLRLGWLKIAQITLKYHKLHILYTTTSRRQFQRLRMCQSWEKSFYTLPPLGGGGGGGGGV